HSFAAVLLLLAAQVLELGVDDLALLRTTARARSARRARRGSARTTGRLAALRLAIHHLGELVGALRQSLLRRLDPVVVLALQRLANLVERLLDCLAISLGELAPVLGQGALGRVHERVRLVADLDLALALRVLGGVRL